MRTVCVGVVIFALVMTIGMTMGSLSAVGQSEETYVPHKTMWVTKRANVRAGPSTSYLKVGLLEVGERVSVTARIRDWFKLSRQAGQPRRFVYAPLLTKTKPDTQTVYIYGGRYHGSIQDGKPHGRGALTWPDGSRYEGEFVNGDFHGRGVYSFANGNRYEGNFLDDVFHGHGVYTWTNGNRYEGDFTNGKRTGRGVFTWGEDTSWAGDRYEGNFLNGKRTGRGLYTWSNGNRYEGDFVDGKHSGRGVYTWANGNRYEGRWRAHKKTGRGTFTFADGDSYTQEWQDGDYLGDAHRPESTCLRVERALYGFWINTCDVGIDVVWSDERWCSPRYKGDKPCSWYVAPKAKRTAHLRGHVRWWECRSPGGLGDVLALEREGRHYCMGRLGDSSKQRRSEQRATAELTIEAEKRSVARDQQRREWLAHERRQALEAERLERLEEQWDSEDEEWRREEERMAAERQRSRDAWQDLMDTINQDARDSYLETLQQLRNSSGPDCRPDVACARSDDAECMARMERYRGLPRC